MKQLFKHTIVSLFFLSLSLFGGSFSCNAPPDKSVPPPDPSKEKFNVILVSMDTLRADRLGCYGYNEYQTSPNMDALAKQGILFENAITSSPWTTPAHLSMLTSLHPSTHGLTVSFGEMWDAFRKKHDSLKLPESRTTLAEALKNKGFATAAFTAGGPIDAVFGFDQGFDIYDTSMFKLYDDNVKKVFNWIEAHSKEQFFMFWHHFEIHAPYLQTDFIDDVMSPREAKIIKLKMKKLSSVPLEKVWPTGAAGLRKKQMAVLEEHELLNQDVCNALYAGGVLSADRWLGRLIQFLREKNLYNRTLIVVTSDHGEEIGDHHNGAYYNKHGHTVYEEMVHIPLIVRLPNQHAAGTRVKQIVRIVDIMPTILDVLSITPKKDQMQGSSLKRYWENPNSTPPQIAYTESLVGRSEKKSLRTSKYKYIISIDQDRVKKHGRKHIPHSSLAPELYYLKKDPKEKNNLLESKTNFKFNKLEMKFNKMLRNHIARQHGKAAPTKINKDTIEKLKGLGYIN